MSLNNTWFFANYPKLDIHGYDSISIELYINQFIEDNVKLKQRYILIVHGIGKGILANKTKEILQKNKLVKDYKRPFFNLGCTVVELVIDI